MRRASSSILASGCAFATTACRLSTHSDELPIQFSAALNRLSDEMNANFGLLAARMDALDADVKAEMDGIRSDVRTQVADMEKRMTADTQSWLQMNERSMFYSRVGCFVVLVFTAISSIALAMPDEFFIKNVRRAAHKKRMEPSS